MGWRREYGVVALLDLTEVRGPFSAVNALRWKKMGGSENENVVFAVRKWLMASVLRAPRKMV